MQQTPCYTSASLSNGRSPSFQNVRVNDSIPLTDGRVNLPTNSHMGMLQTIDGVGIKMEPSFLGSSEELIFQSNNLCQGPALSSFINPELDDFGGLDQIPQHLGFSNLTAEFSPSDGGLRRFFFSTRFFEVIRLNFS